MKHRFAPTGHLALAPQAFGMEFDVDVRAPMVQRNGVAVVEIRGPLSHHASFWGDSYEAIRGRVGEALALGPRALLLVIDSPGGLVSGCFETSRAIRAAAHAASVPLVAYIDGSALSAAYALAVSADRICVPPTGIVGSIGIIEALVDATKQAEMFGVSFKLVASGARKTDGHPQIPTSDEAVVVAQTRVNELAELFFELVTEARAVSTDDLRALEAGILHGAQAVAAGLADEVTTLDDLLAALASGSPAPAGQASEETMDEEEKARAALQAICDDEKADAKAKAKARKALAAMDDDEEEPEAKAEGDDEPEPKKDDDEAKAIAAKALAGVTRLEAAQAKAAEDAERARLLATRPDLDEPTKALLASASVADVKAFVEKAPRRALKPAASAVVGGTLAEGQGTGEPSDPASTETRNAIRTGMGRAEATAAPRIEGTRQIFPQMTRAQGVKWLEDRAKARAEGTKGTSAS